jgi:hypothetical protein
VSEPLDPYLDELRKALALGAEVVLIAHTQETAAVARVYLAAGQELLAGVISELEAERPTDGHQAGPSPLRVRAGTRLRSTSTAR